VEIGLPNRILPIFQVVEYLRAFLSGRIGWSSLRSLLIISGGRLTGIITERDLLRAVALGADPDRSTVDEPMTTEVFTVPPHMPLQEAARQMAVLWIRHLPVVAGDEVLGVVSMRDITGVFAALAPGRVDVEHEFDQLVRERRLARIEHGDLD